MYFITKETCEKISSILKLPYTGTEQDWELEMADRHRIKEFIEFVSTAVLNENETYAVIALIIASYDDVLDYGMHDIDIWQKIKLIILNNKELCNGLLDYWSCKESSYSYPPDEFNISPLIRELL